MSDEKRSIRERFEALDDQGKRDVAEMCSIVEDACTPLRAEVEILKAQRSEWQRALSAAFDAHGCFCDGWWENDLSPNQKWVHHERCEILPLLSEANP